MSDFCYFLLTCADAEEANKISDELLDKKLAVCAKTQSVKSSFRWKEKIEQSEEVLLMLTSRTDLFDQVEHVVQQLHSYETFVLETVPLTTVNEAAKVWMQENLLVITRSEK